MSLFPFLRRAAALVVFLAGCWTGAAAPKFSTPFDQNFPFQTACIGSKLQTNFAGRVGPDGKPVLDPNGRQVIDGYLTPAENTHKAIALKLGNDASLLFDTDLLRVSAGWTGNYLRFHGVAFDGVHGGWSLIGGEQQFGSPTMPGWADANGTFKDPRPEPFGPLPASHARWNGLYVVGDKVVLSYTVGETKILEYPKSEVQGGLIGFVRNVQIEKTAQPLKMLVCRVDGGTGTADGQKALLRDPGGSVTAVGLAGAPKGAILSVESQNFVVLKIPKDTPAALFKLVIWKGSPADQGKFAAFLSGKAEMIPFAKGGPAHWPQSVETRGVLATNRTPDGAYVLDQLTPPLENPWNRFVRLSGLDFFSDGKRAALCTWDGDIWIVSGIDDTLEKLTWKRFASGMYETLGLKIVNDVIYTSGRDQLTRYHDLNGDGEADFYENFNNQVTSSTGFHEFVFDLETDKLGNFYFAKAGPVRYGGRGFGGDHYGTITACAGTIMKVSPDGKKLEVVATGFRAPNGISVGPDGQLTSGDNEGTWVPQCPINWIKPGGYYGVKETAHRPVLPERDKPLCWLPYGTFDNSGGSQVWVTSDKWGPFAGELLHLSYGQCALFLVMKESVKGQMQGGVVRIPVNFTSSAMRGRFNPRDGQLYVTGLLGWQTKAVKPTGLDRVRYTGKPVYSAAKLKVLKDGVQLTFTQPLDAAAAGDLQNYSAQRWDLETHYVDDKVVEGRIVRAPNFNPLNYGGHEVLPADHLKIGRETVNITGTKLSDDGKTVTLQMADFKPVQQLIIKFLLKARDGTPIEQEVAQTIHVLP